MIYLEYLVFFRIQNETFGNRQGENGGWIREDIKPFSNLDEARKYIINRCLHSSYRLNDFRIFSEYKFDIEIVNIEGDNI